MKKRAKKVLLAVLTAALLITGKSGVSVFASDRESYDDIATECNIELPENTDDSREYCEFTNPNMRMESDGSFSFSYQRSMQSDDFKPASSSITVYATATSSTSDQTYYIALYKVNTSGNDTQTL